MPENLPLPKGYRKLRKGEKIQSTDKFYIHGSVELGLSYALSGSVGKPWDTSRTHYYRAIESNQKPKEPKTMQTKKPGTTHGKPTAKGMKVEKKPTTAKVSKYPAPREALGIMIPDYRNPKSKATKADLVDQVFDLLDTALDARKDLATTGTKLDRALVDLKEAKKRIKELERKMSGEII